MQNEIPLKIAFFGTPDIAVWALGELVSAGYTPSLIVTVPDKPQGRKMLLTPPPTKVWALEHNIEVFQPETLKTKELLDLLTEQEWDLFIVVAYGLIMPSWLIDLPKYKTLNVHPSLLPKLRGASPIRTSILGDYNDTGVTIMLMDEKMDHGPILVQEKYDGATPVPGSVLDQTLARKGGKMLAELIPSWTSGTLTPLEQNHTEATFCSKIEKKDAELILDPELLPTGEGAYKMLLKINAYDGWPQAFFFHNGKRIKIISAHIENDTLVLERVVPEGKKEMDFKQYISS